MQSTDERKCRYLLITIGVLGKLVLEEIDVGVEAISRPHPEGEEMVTTSFGFLTSGVLCEEGLSNLREVVESAVVRSRTT